MYISTIPHKWIVLFACADWLARSSLQASPLFGSHARFVWARAVRCEILFWAWAARGLGRGQANPLAPAPILLRLAPKINLAWDPNRELACRLGPEVISQVLFTFEQLQKNKMAFVGILSQINLPFGPLVIQLVWFILKQLFTSVLVKVVDIYLHFSE